MLSAIFENKNSMRFFHHLVLVMLFAISLNSHSAANQPTDHIRVVTETLPPYQIQHANGQIDGYATDVIKALFMLTQDNYQIKVLPWARAYEMASSGNNTLIYSMTRTVERENKFHWIGALDKSQFSFWSLPHQEMPENLTLNHLKNIPIACARNYVAEQFLIKQNFTEIHSVNKEFQSIKMLKSNRVKLVLSNRVIFNNYANDLGYQSSDFKTVLTVPELSSYLYIAASKNSDPAFINKYRQAFLQLAQSGQLASIKRKWNIPESDSSPVFTKPKYSVRRSIH
ncbi:substrate-binding periplasmic protein [Thalassotalea sp. PLHSN55]|uniref:substrate-binding periplasmic protein n=1 Tax=Thalassotalea sp. PLHSN55 TaxID=3435888 RepID=UPI003F870653